MVQRSQFCTLQFSKDPKEMDRCLDEIPLSHLECDAKDLLQKDMFITKVGKNIKSPPLSWL